MEHGITNVHVPRIHRILEKLAAVRASGLSCFGSDTHGFLLNDPLPEPALCDFETAHGARLPADYRAFLQFAGNGGAGPYYGIYALNRWNDFIDWVSDEPRADVLKRPCPLFPGMERTQDWQNWFGDTCPWQGTISLGSQGCTYAMLLIVFGQYAGRVVYVDADGGAPYVVWERDFLSWYERWLDELLNGYKLHWFGYGPGGTEEDFFRFVDDPNLRDVFRSEAAYAFQRLPRLPSAAAQAIPGYLRHPIAGVRAGACATIGSFNLRHAEGATADLLSDPSPEVRRQAVWTLMQFDPVRWSESVRRQFLIETDGDVAKSAFFKLKDANALSKADLIWIIDRSPHAGLRGLAAWAVEWARADRALLMRLASDPDDQVRHYAAIGLRQIGATSVRP